MDLAGCNAKKRGSRERSHLLESTHATLYHIIHHTIYVHSHARIPLLYIKSIHMPRKAVALALLGGGGLALLGAAHATCPALKKRPYCCIVKAASASEGSTMTKARVNTSIAPNKCMMWF